MCLCIYCKKSDDGFTLEHIIPQFLGGAQAPDKLKTRDVCRKCNSNLGLFVDAAFEKDFLVFDTLKESEYFFFNSEKAIALPLTCKGISDLIIPEMEENEICEAWQGPLGEQVYWVREQDKRMNSYSGGNPRTGKKVPSRAYFICSERSQEDILQTWRAFKNAFADRPVKKIMCTKIKGADLRAIGFSEPDELDDLRIQYILNQCKSGKRRRSEILIDRRCHMRFMAKLALGMSHVLFGRHAGNSEYSEELYKALWFKEGNVEPNIHYEKELSNSDPNQFLTKYHGIPYGVTITIFPSPQGVIVNLNLNRRMNWAIVCAKRQDLTSKQIEDLRDGICIVLVKSLKKGLELSLSQLTDHNLGRLRHPGLSEIERLVVNYYESDRLLRDL
ncbi:HNH endonuclease [Geitlerinema sp. PCC 7407]|uniref:HNH endonuclease n=1 Tax=Geitlerinema sp. PCC 7407 TaxID=1173025 RepID=UPI00029FD70D|nr:HNH endonuclease [Geitlerinema sp. PCC 7407]AFY66682.1 hypothetical protein GEI7407_2203 [Geitlerinema sp. PCC 7407]